jgi:hypothetical protein
MYTTDDCGASVIAILIRISFSPTVLTQYPRDQKWRPQYLSVNFSYLSNNFSANLPLRNPVILDTECFGVIDKTI